MGMIKEKAISCIPTNDEKYISFSIGDLTFIDSLQFLDASLEQLVSNPAKEGVGKFRVLNRYIDDEKVPLLLRKDIYPYEHFDSFSKFSETCLPPDRRSKMNILARRIMLTLKKFSNSFAVIPWGTITICV